MGFRKGTGAQTLNPNTMKSLYTRTFFRVVIPTDFGEKVAVVGSEPQLGNWQVSLCALVVERCFSFSSLNACMHA